MCSILQTLRRPPFQHYAIGASVMLLDVLHDVDSFPCLYFNHTVLREAIRRYETLWLPLLFGLKTRSARLQLVPPLDVEWVWIVHMLSPAHYVGDCTNIYRKLVRELSPLQSVVRHLSKPVASWFNPVFFDHEFPDSDEKRQQYLRAAKKLWDSQYPGEQFDITADLVNEPTITPREDKVDEHGISGPSELEHASIIEYDIVSAAARLKAFHYHVGVSPHYAQSFDFHLSSLLRYLQFQKLWKRHAHAHPERPLVATCDIELMRFTHMCHPRNFQLDYPGRLRHVQTPKNDGRKSGFGVEQEKNDHSPAVPFYPSLEDWENSKRLWVTVRSQNSLPRDGAMWRGNLTAQECLLRDAIARAVESINCRASQASLCFRVSEEQDKQLKLPLTSRYHAVKWVHNTEFLRYLAFERVQSTNVFPHMHTEIPFVRRLSSFTVVSGDNDTSELDQNSKIKERQMLKGCVTSFIARDGDNVGSLLNTIEIFTSDEDGDDEHESKTEAEEKAQSLPIASAHSALPGSVYIHPAEKTYFAELLLREGGFDRGILAGVWERFDLLDRRGGYLDLWWYDLSDRTAHARWESLEIVTPGAISNLDRPLMYRFRDCDDDVLFEFDLSSGFIRFIGTHKQTARKPNVAFAYLVTLAASTLFVQLQPRVTQDDSPDGNTNSPLSFYPSWCSIQQGEFETLRAAGAEVIESRPSSSLGRQTSTTAATATGIPHLMNREEVPGFHNDSPNKYVSDHKPTSCTNSISHIRGARLFVPPPPWTDGTERPSTTNVVENNY